MDANCKCRLAENLVAIRRLFGRAKARPYVFCELARPFKNAGNKFDAPLLFLKTSIDPLKSLKSIDTVCI